MNYASMNLLVALWVVPQAILRFNNTLGGLTELGKKAVICTVIVYYNERIETKISNGKRVTGQSPGEFQVGANRCPLPALTSLSNDGWQ